MIEDMIIKMDKREEDMREVFAEAPKREKAGGRRPRESPWFWSAWSRG
ncbi:MAG: hypothetical protein ACLR2E_00525 [Lachnospiraceae bacterium]